MPSETVLKMVFNLVGGLGVFLMGMSYMQQGLQMVAGNSFRKLINVMTSNRFFAVGVGVTVTTVIQSSSITTIMVVGLVNSELMALQSAIGVIMGANIGTTITGWIMAIKVGKYGLPLLGVASFFWLFSKKEKVKYIALAFLGIGMIFFGLELMKNGFKPIRTMPEFAAWFHAFDATTYFGVLKCAMVGCIVTLVVQSSSATLGITISLALTGVIPFETAAALVLGENIGTTITAFLASLGTGLNARRVAYFHIIFNLLGVFWITAVFRIYLPIVESVLSVDPNFMEMVNGEPSYPYVAASIAAVHTGFNLANTLLFLPFTHVFANLLNRIGTGVRKTKDTYLTNLDFEAYKSPFSGMERSSHEIERMDIHVKGMFNNLKNIITNPGETDELIKEVFEREDILDHVQKEITTFLTGLLSKSLSQELALEGQMQLRMADEYESVSDDITAILKLHLKLRDQNIPLTSHQGEELLELHDAVYAYYTFVRSGILNHSEQFIVHANQQSGEISRLVKCLRDRHWERLSEGEVSPIVSTTYMDIANIYRGIKDHLQNVAEAIAGKKLIS
jgi:phosphate:Na+ symporter